VTVRLTSDRDRADIARVSWQILGPDGNPMIVGGTSDHPMEREYAQTIAKKVRSRGIGATVAADRNRGRDKPTPVTFETLRLMAQRNEWVRAIVSKRARQIRALKGEVVVRDDAGDDPSGAAQRAAKSMNKLLTRPQMHGSQPNGVHWQQFISQWLEDLLVLDRACIEKERDGRGWIKALYVVDGATVRPNIDDRGAYFHPDAYVQMIDGIAVARFGMEDLSVTMDNPQSDVRLAGYGLSPLESLVVSVTADLHAAKFNSSYFEKGAIPEGILHLGEDIDPELVDAFRLFWLNEVQGNPNAFPIIGGGKQPEFLQWRQPNRDMQFMEYQQWLLQKMCAVFQISQKDLGQIDDVNRSTAEDASAQQEQTGVKPLQDLVKNMLDLEVIGELGQGLGDYLEWKWEEPGESADQINQKYQPMHAAGVATGGEWRDAHGLEPDGDPQATHGKDGLRMHLAGGQPLPSREDADVLGAAHQQDREDDLGERQAAREDQVADADHQRELEKAGAEGGEPTGVPWKPADPEDPDVQAAMASHDEEQGIGPRNVKKTAPPTWIADLHVEKRDRNQPMTRAEEDLVGEFDRATDKLITGLTDLLSGGHQ
jgi:phage portal protein BeeE